MNTDQIVEALREEARNLVWPGETVERLPLITRRSSTDGEMNMVTAFALDASSADEAIRAEVDHFEGLGREFEWKMFSFDTPPDLLARLDAAGFAIGAREAVVVYDLADGIAPLEADLPCQVVRIESLKLLDDYRSVAEEVFGKDYSFTTNQLADAIAAGWRGHLGYVGYIDGVPATIGRLYTNPQSKFAGLYGGGTRVQFRSQGCYRAMVAARARDSLERGSRYLQVDALPTSLPILLRLGFTHIADTWPAIVRER